VLLSAIWLWASFLYCLAHKAVSSLLGTPVDCQTRYLFPVNPSPSDYYYYVLLLLSSWWRNICQSKINWRIAVAVVLMTTLTVRCQSVRGRPGRLLPSIGFQLVACRAILRESILMTCPAHLSPLSLMVSSSIPCWASSPTFSLVTVSFHEMCTIFPSHLWCLHFLVVDFVIGQVHAP